MAKALFGSVVAPHELRVAEENAALRARVRRLEQQLVLLQEERDSAIARELLGMAHESAAPALAATSA
jgi:cell division protein FtsB